ENLLPIPSKCKVTLEDKRECDFPIYEKSLVCDNHSDTFSDSKIDDDISVYDDDFEDIEYVEASIVSIEEDNDVEEENVIQQEEEEDNLSIPRPPPEPPDTETDTVEEIPVVMNDKDEDVYSSFIFVIFAEEFSFLSAESEDTIFDPGISD
nr:hypothetical protein [Tanacetum cinerariifolium]